MLLAAALLWLATDKAAFREPEPRGRSRALSVPLGSGPSGRREQLVLGAVAGGQQGSAQYGAAAQCAGPHLGGERRHPG